MNDPFTMDLLLLQNAAHYDLSEESERQRSNQDLVSFFQNLQQRIRPQLTVEIGAFNARFSVEMRRRGIRAVAVEANPYNFEAFRNEKSLIDAGVEYFHMAIASKDGVVDFQLQKRVGTESVTPVRGNNSLLRRTTSNIEYEQVSVPSSSLVTFFQNNGIKGNSFSAWIDVEGAIAEVLAGAGTVFSECLSIMIEVEQHRFWENQWLVLDVMNYFLKWNMVPVARDFEFTHQYNMVFVSRGILFDSTVQDALALYNSRIARRPPTTKTS